MRGKKNSRGVIAEAETEVTRIFNSLERNLEYRLKYVERKSYEELFLKMKIKGNSKAKNTLGIFKLIKKAPTQTFYQKFSPRNLKIRVINCGSGIISNFRMSETVDIKLHIPLLKLYS